MTPRLVISENGVYANLCNMQTFAKGDEKDKNEKVELKKQKSKIEKIGNDLKYI